MLGSWWKRRWIYCAWMQTETKAAAADLLMCSFHYTTCVDVVQDSEWSMNINNINRNTIIKDKRWLNDLCSAPHCDSSSVSKAGTKLHFFVCRCMIWVLKDKGAGIFCPLNFCCVLFHVWIFRWCKSITWYVRSNLYCLSKLIQFKLILDESVTSEWSENPQRY